MTLYFLTENINKVKEIKQILDIPIEQLDVELPEIQEVNSEKIIKAKLNEAIKIQKGEFIVEDTSLYFEAMNNLPGPLIKWFLQELGRGGLFELAKKHDNYNATATTLIGYFDGKQTHFFKGSTKGKIVYPKAQSDFGWDPIFQPEGFSITYAEMTREEKNLISHRKKAVKKLKEYLDTTKKD